MPKTRRRRADSEQYWRDTIAAWEESGQSLSAFCTDRGIGQATFYAWRRRLARRDPAPCPAAPAAPIPSFAAVRVIPDPTVEVVLPVGLVVRVPGGADPAAVARLVAALGGAPC
jgi:hypothetical protein